MKKSIIVATALVLSLLISANAFAKDAKDLTGCRALTNTTWAGKISLANGQFVEPKIVITGVRELMPDYLYILEGTMNGETLAIVPNCFEEKGAITDLTFEINNITAIQSKTIMPADKPTNILEIQGGWHSIPAERGYLSKTP